MALRVAIAGCVEVSVQLVLHWLQQVKQDIQIQDIKPFFFFPVALRPDADHGLLILDEVS